MFRMDPGLGFVFIYLFFAFFRCVYALKPNNGIRATCETFLIRLYVYNFWYTWACLWLSWLGYDTICIYMRVYMILNIYNIHDWLYNHMMIVCIVVYVYMIYIWFLLWGLYTIRFPKHRQIWWNLIAVFDFSKRYAFSDWKRASEQNW